jgi:hypothetical protein
MGAIRIVDTDVAIVADALIVAKLAGPEAAPNNGQINWAYQRDAVVSALELARIPVKSQNLSVRPAEGAPLDGSSIFDSEDDVMTIEDLAILQDLDAPDEEWKLIRRQKYPAKTYSNGSTKLTVILANKLTLEHQLGVDLIYVNETLKSVVFVQYKMFTGMDGERGYRPDKQISIEIKRMDKAAKEIAKVPADVSCAGYRITSEAFFLKFCKKLLSHQDVGHVPGYYIPLGFWKRLMQAPTVKGPKGGTIIYPETLGKRFFTPTGFVDLVHRGWIGTSTPQTDILVQYMKDAMRGNKGVVLAVQSESKAITESLGEE